MVFWFIIEHTMLPIFFLVVLGYFLDKKFHLDVKTLSKLMFFLVIPSFIFTNIYTTQFPGDEHQHHRGHRHLHGHLLRHRQHRRPYPPLRCSHAGIVPQCLHVQQHGKSRCRLIILVFSHNPFVVNGQTPYLAEAMVVQIIIFMIQSISLNTLGLYQAGRGRLTARDTLSVMFHMPLLYVLAAALIARYVAGTPRTSSCGLSWIWPARPSCPWPWSASVPSCRREDPMARQGRLDCQHPQDDGPALIGLA